MASNRDPVVSDTELDHTAIIDHRIRSTPENADPGSLAWNRRVSELLACPDESEAIAKSLIRALETLVPDQSYVVGFVGSNLRHEIYWSHISSEVTGLAEELASEIAGRARVDDLDPFVVAAREGRSGFMPLWDVAPPGFDSSELYSLSYASLGIIDVLEHLLAWDDFWIVAGTFGARLFESLEISRHEAAAPVIETCERRLASCYFAEKGSPDRNPAPPNIDGVLSRFGADSLTERERDVIHLLLRGHNSESVAQQLSIAWHTVRSHRRNAYAKLGVTTHGELMYEFLRTCGLSPDG